MKTQLSSVLFAEEQLTAQLRQGWQWSPKSRLSSQSGAAGDGTNLIPVVKNSNGFERERNSFPFGYELPCSDLSQNFIMGFQASQPNSFLFPLL